MSIKNRGVVLGVVGTLLLILSLMQLNGSEISKNAFDEFYAELIIASLVLIGGAATYFTENLTIYRITKYGLILGLIIFILAGILFGAGLRI